MLPPMALGLSWRWDGESEETAVRIELRPDGAGTLVHVEHAGFPSAAAAADHTQGWSDCLDRLPGYLAGEAG